MTLALLGIGAALAAAGTRVSALAFAGAAVVAARGGILPALGIWTALTALSFVGLRGSPRRLAMPVLGAVAGLASGSARNTAVVGALWVLATIAAVFSRGRGADADRWAISVCAADVPFLAAVAWTATRVGFEGWPAELDAVGIGLLLGAAVLRAALASGPEDAPEAGLLPVRVQTLAVLHILAAASPGRDTLAFTMIVAALGFAVGGCFRRPVTRDAAQEIALVALVLSAGALAWAPTGWEWAAMGAGTLIHSLRLREQVRPWAPLAAVLLRGGGVMLPTLPVLLVGLEGALRADGAAKIAVPVALLAGMSARSAHEESDPRRAPAAKSWEAAAFAAVMAAAVLASVWAPVFTVPGAAAAAISWPPAWAVGVVVGPAAALGLVGGVRGRSKQPRRLPLTFAELRLPTGSAAGRRLILAQVGLAALAVGVFILGALRGFL